MFDLGFSELFLVAVVALVVLGPEKLPKATRFVGLWVRRARAQWQSVKGELERELASEELKRNLEDARTAMRDLESSARGAGEDARTGFESMRDQTLDGLDPSRPRRDAGGAAAPTLAVGGTDAAGRTDGTPRPDAEAAATLDGEAPATDGAEAASVHDPDADNRDDDDAFAPWEVPATNDHTRNPGADGDR